VADELDSWARERAPDLLARAEAEAVAVLRDALIDAALEERSRDRPPRRSRQTSAPSAPEPVSTSAEPAGDGLWAYCVLQAGEPLPPDAHAIGESPLELVEADGLAALVSRVPLNEFGAAPLRENLNDLAWLDRVARGHEAVLERFLGESTLVPLRLCTIYESEQGVRDMLQREHDSLVRALDALRGREEWGVKLLADGDRLADEARSRSSEVAALEEELGSRTGGGAYMLGRRLERHVREAADALAAEVAEEVGAELEPCAIDSVGLPPQNPELSGHEGRMLLNRAYLVEAEHVQELRGLAAELEQRHSALGVHIELTGPWPPYNFLPAGP
jgi:hypothetical protein